MTHEELFQKLSDIAHKKDAHEARNDYLLALRAVVELHKPVMAFTGGYDGEENELWEEQCQDCSGNGFSQMYPCPTIETIIEELK